MALAPRPGCVQTDERKRTKIESLKVKYNKVFGYYIEVSRANSSKVPDDYERKQTLVNAERFITPELKDFESQVLNAEEQIKKIEARVFDELCGLLAKSAEKLIKTARTLAKLDVLTRGLLQCARRPLTDFP